MNRPYLNRIAIWQAIPEKELYSNQYQADLEYIISPSNVIKSVSVAEPLYSYARNFVKDKLNFALFIYTDEKSAVKMDKFLKDTAKKIKKTDVLEILAMSGRNSYRYLDIYYKGDK